MNAPGKSLLKAVSILFIIGGVTFTAITIIMLALNIFPGMTSELGAFAALFSSISIASIALILVIATNVIQLIIGIIGLKKCGDPLKAQFFIITGLILFILALAGIILSIMDEKFSFLSLIVISFVLPILYIVGGVQNKKAISPSM